MEKEPLNSEDIRVNLAHVPDYYNRYPGEIVSLSTCLQMPASRHSFMLEKASLWVSLPEECELIDFEAREDKAILSAEVRSISSREYVVWQLADLHAQGQRIEFLVRMRVRKPDLEIPAVSQAILRDADGNELAGETLRIRIKLLGDYINYLPEIYRQDDLMSRFLMLFESFWKPLDRQIRQVSNYFDPDMAPEQFLPWLASWVGAYWDEIVPEDRRRRMLRMAVSLYQRRGTRSALKDFLTAFSDGEVQIIEHPACNLVLGNATRLGPKTALGLNNSPDTFSVDMKIRKDRFNLQKNPDDRKLEEMLYKKILAIIDTQKPAHTICRLNLQMVNPQDCADR